MTCNCKLQNVSTIDDLMNLGFEDFRKCVLCGNCNIPTVGKLAQNVGLSRLTARRINGSTSDNYTQALLSLGCDEELIYAVSERKRTTYFLDNPLRLKELMEECANKNNCLIQELTQKMLLDFPLIKAIFPTKIRYTFDFKAKILGQKSLLATHGVLPQNYLERYPLQARKEFNALKKNVCHENKWPSVKSIRMDPVGRKMMDHFGNSVTKMCEHFGESDFQTHSAPQSSMDDLEYVKELIESAVQKMGKQLSELPSIPLKKLDKLVSGSLATACSRNHNVSYANLCIKLFPNYNFSHYDFIGGVEDYHWIDQEGSLVLENIRKAVLWLVPKIQGNNPEKSPNNLIPLLKKADFTPYGLSYLANLPGFTLLETLREAFPEIDFSETRRYGNDNCGERLYFIISDYFDESHNDLQNCLEVRLCVGQSNSCYLRSDVVIQFYNCTVHFEIQGPQHIDSSHQIHKNSRYFDSFERQIKNDGIKFNYHQQNENIIVYLKPEQLTLDEAIEESLRQGLDIVNGTYCPPSLDQRIDYLVSNGLLSRDVFDSVR